MFPGASTTSPACLPRSSVHRSPLRSSLFLPSFFLPSLCLSLLVFLFFLCPQSYYLALRPDPLLYAHTPLLRFGLRLPVCCMDSKGKDKVYKHPADISRGSLSPAEPLIASSCLSKSVIFETNDCLTIHHRLHLRVTFRSWDSCESRRIL